MTNAKNDANRQSVISLAEWRAARDLDQQATDPHAPPPCPKPVYDPPAAVLEGVSCMSAGHKRIDNLSLSISSSGASVVVGPKGAGKSLLLRLLARVVEPSAGSVIAPPPGKGGSIMVFQKPVLLRRSVRGNLEHALKLAEIDRSERGAIIEALLAAGNLTELADRPARALSIDAQQRIAIMRALAFRPTLLMLDEPTASLDARATALIEALISGASEAGVKVVLVTHDIGQARRLASEIIVLRRGGLAEQTLAPLFFEKPRSTAGRAFRDSLLDL